MAEHSSIEWTDATWNPITGCTLVSEGCANCYAAELAAGRLKNHPSRVGLARRNGAGVAKFTGEVRFNEKALDEPLRWARPRLIFVCAHGDLFHESVPDEWIDRIFAVMAFGATPGPNGEGGHVYQVLTKRPERMRTYVSDPGTLDRVRAAYNAFVIEQTGWDAAAEGLRPHIHWPLPNVWLGTSIEDQARADERIPHLLATPAAIRFVSAEPLLGPIDLTGFIERTDWRDLHWVIVGGESGKFARPMHPDWARSLRDQCAAAGVPFLFKQWGAWEPGDWSLDLDDQLHFTPLDESRPLHYAKPADDPDEHFWDMDDLPEGPGALRVGKKAAGRLLDGVQHDGMPAARGVVQ